LDMLSFVRDKNQHCVPDIDRTRFSIASASPAQLEVRQRCR